MASAQVAPNSAAQSSRKQEHLEAGKKRLEEFRKRKAAKKAVSGGPLQSADADQQGKLLQKNDDMADGPISSTDTSITTSPSPSVWIHENSSVNSSQSVDIHSANGLSATSASQYTINPIPHGDSLRESENNEVLRLYGSSGSSRLANGYYENLRESDELSYSKSDVDKNIKNSSFSSSIEVHSSGNKNSTIYVHDSGPSGEYHSGNLPGKSESSFAQNRFGNDVGMSTTASTSGFEDSGDAVEHRAHGSSLDHDDAASNTKGGEKITNAFHRHLDIDSALWNSSKPSPTDFSMGVKNSYDEFRFPSSSYGRSRPSFLDALGVNKVSSTSEEPYTEPDKANPPISVNNPKVQNSFSQWQPSSGSNFAFNSSTSDFLSGRESAANNSGALNDWQNLKHNAETYQSFATAKKDEDFAALEQHIEDLTQEKFSLQRALDTSKTLSESLAAENSSLTDRYNEQAKVINQLKSDMERLQEEIKAQLMVFESVKLEYANAQLECNAADERAKILASEVISLEEKALRLRSNELKLEKQVENLASEISSYKRKMSILEKERQDFQYTIDAFQEEKKLLQSKLRKASGSEKVNETRKTYSNKKDASTLTEDLGAERFNMAEGGSGTPAILDSSLNSSEDIGPSVSLSSNASSISLSPDNTFGGIPQDQLRMINNISSLLSELAVERDELMQALRIESSNCSKLKDLNKDLSKKLEAQTQRLELLTAQQMANEHVLAKPMDVHIVNDTTEYADEGDEVVERVLGWIMRLFPGGPAKRRTSKLL
uniref:Protein BLISTER n=1 Tax=Ananas comosus var. bracteatus TaxID=296719 RepID=A0A6V7QSN1_ANACO